MIENGWQDLTGSDKPTEEFLEQLLQYARWYGWRGDVNEIFDFIDALRLEAGMEELTKKQMVLLPHDDPEDNDMMGSDETVLEEEDNLPLPEEDDDAAPRIR